VSATRASGREGRQAGELLALGISHKTAGVALRERLAFTESEGTEFALQATATDEVHEAVVICTCNRTEVYLVVGGAGGSLVKAESDVLGLLARRAEIRPTELAEAIYSPRNCDAARQLYRVTAGLESMIIGEAEIQGQVRRAHEAAMRAGATGPLSNRLFAAALTTGKRVRSETEIGSSRVSVPSVAVDLALSVLGGLEDRHVVVLGAGETSELTARALAEQGAGTMFVANRHADRALSLAQRFGGSVIGLDKLPDQLVRTDIVVSSTASPHPIVGREELELVMAERHGRPLLLIDMAVPRDIDPACSELDGVSLYDIDDLQAVIARNLSTRAEETPKALEIVEEEIHRFARWLGQLDALPTISALRAHGDDIVERVLAENAGRWEAASPRDLARVDAIARAVMSRLLHEPTIRLRGLGEDHTLMGAGSHASFELVRELFALRTDEPADEGRPSELAEVHELRSRRSAGRTGGSPSTG
jgi:glutamyl-tRNA reductase